MDKRKRWLVFRGRLFIIVGVAAILAAAFLPSQIPDGLYPLVIVFGIGLIALAVPFRVLRNLPVWFKRDDTWL
jgi:uncharacterized membrane-anchored protein